MEAEGQRLAEYPLFVRLSERLHLADASGPFGRKGSAFEPRRGPFAREVVEVARAVAGTSGDLGHGEGAPRDPPRRPDRRFPVMREALRKQRPGLLDAPGIERRPEPGPKQESAESEKHPLVIRAPAPLLRARPDDTPEITVRRQRPCRAIAEHPLQVAPHVLGARILDRLLPEDDLQLLAGCVDVARQLRDSPGFTRFRAELELELPALRAFAEDLEGADLGERRPQPHWRNAFARDHGLQRRKLRQIVVDLRQIAGALGAEPR